MVLGYYFTFIMAEKQNKISDDIEASGPITYVPSQTGEILKEENITHDPVFGEVTEDGPNYRNVTCSPGPVL